METRSRKRTRRYLHYDDYIVDFDSAGYSLDDINIIKSVHDALNSAASNLLQRGLLHDFQKFFELVGKNEFPLDNIAFLLFIDLIKFYSLESATQMRYNKDTYLFWIFGYLLLKGRFIRFMSGTKFKGTLIDRSAIRGSFSPSISKINFSVPSESALRGEADSLDIPRTIGPGIITFFIDILDRYSKNVVLSCGGKMIKEGVSKESDDVDLYGTGHGHLY